jgi:glycosyltransferase involved in cell wall biosynthesis
VVGGEIKDESLMANIYQKSVVTVVPSKMENLPFVAMESLACGTPIVAYNVGGIPDLVEHGKNGYLAKPYDIKDLSKGVETIVTSSILQKEYGKYGRAKMVESFNLKNVAKHYLSLYESLI